MKGHSFSLIVDEISKVVFHVLNILENWQTIVFQYTCMHMRTAKAQISSLSANRAIGYYRMYDLSAKVRMIFCAGLSEFAHFLHIRSQVFA